MYDDKIHMRLNQREYRTLRRRFDTDDDFYEWIRMTMDYAIDADIDPPAAPPPVLPLKHFDIPVSRQRFRVYDRRARDIDIRLEQWVRECLFGIELPE